MKIIVASSLLVIFISAVSANRDDSYYVGGVENPNVKSNMYWHEGRNVLEDLDQFDALYVTYHNCAWETPTGDDEDGGGGGDGDDWYLGSVPGFRANVAFSLYGKLKNSKQSGCSKKTFINSFHTTQGLESFTNAMAQAGLTNLFDYYDGDGNEEDAYGVITSNCYQNEDEDGDGDDYYYNGDKMYGTTSYGLGCSADGSRTFAMHTYSGGYCDANAINGTSDDLEDLNERLDLSKCVPIYESGDHYSADDDENVSPLSLLETSRACRVYDGTGSCPDPYNKLKQYEKNLLKSTGAIPNIAWVNQYRMAVISYTMIAVGGVLIMAAIAMASMDCTADGLGSAKKFRKKKKAKKAKKKKDKDKKSSKVYKSKSQTTSKVDKEAQVDADLAKSTSYTNDDTQTSDVDAVDDQSVEISARFGTPEPKSDEEPMSEEELFSDEEPDQSPIKTKPSEEISIASASVQAVNDMVHFFKNKASEVFNDEPEGDDEKDFLPHNSPSKAADETEVGSDNWTNQEEVVSKKKYRKRRWLSKLLRGSAKKQNNNGRFY